jgi:hypothetical protein
MEEPALHAGGPHHDPTGRARFHATDPEIKSDAEPDVEKQEGELNGPAQHLGVVGGARRVSFLGNAETLVSEFAGRADRRRARARHSFPAESPSRRLVATSL